MLIILLFAQTVHGAIHEAKTLVKNISCDCLEQYSFILLNILESLFFAVQVKYVQYNNKPLTTVIVKLMCNKTQLWI